MDVTQATCKQIKPWKHPTTCTKLINSSPHKSNLWLLTKCFFHFNFIILLSTIMRLHSCGASHPIHCAFNTCCHHNNYIVMLLWQNLSPHTLLLFNMSANQSSQQLELEALLLVLISHKYHYLQNALTDLLVHMPTSKSLSFLLLNGSILSFVLKISQSLQDCNAGYPQWMIFPALEWFPGCLSLFYQNPFTLIFIFIFNASTFADHCPSFHLPLNISICLITGRRGKYVNMTHCISTLTQCCNSSNSYIFFFLVSFCALSSTLLKSRKESFMLFWLQ